MNRFFFVIVIFKMASEQVNFDNLNAATDRHLSINYD